LNHKLLALFGLKWNPFVPDLPVEALWRHKDLDHFCWRLETLVQEGGFALISGDPGTGKSAALRTLAHHLAHLPDVRTGVLTRPQSRLPDFYRELGQLFGVALTPHNRWAGFKALRQTWLAHVDATTQRPVLLIDEAQELAANVLAELRILASADFDSRSILTVVLCGDTRLTQLFRRDDFLPIASRVRVRLNLDYLQPETLADWLQHSVSQAGNPNLLSHEVLVTLSEHAAGNLRVLATMANELLAMAAKRELSHIDQKLYLEVFAPPTHNRKPRRARG
jgi:type II secretory pathway predicted ATPase ExeA